MQNVESSSEDENREEVPEEEWDSDDELISDVESLQDSSNISAVDLRPNSHVLVVVHGKKSRAHFAAIISSVCKHDDTAEVSFLMRKGANFTSPDKADVATVDIADIVMLLPDPHIVGGTERTCKAMIYGIDLSSYF